MSYEICAWVYKTWLFIYQKNHEIKETYDEKKMTNLSINFGNALQINLNSNYKIWTKYKKIVESSTFIIQILNIQI